MNCTLTMLLAVQVLFPAADTKPEGYDGAQVRMEDGVASVLRAHADGDYVTLTPKRSRFDLSNTSVQYVLLPVYLLNLEFNKKKYRFAVNGQTGKVVGELPVSKAISRLYFGGIASGVAVLGTFLAYLIFR